MRTAAAIACAAAIAAAHAETVKVAECVRNPQLDDWAANDVNFCRSVMDPVFRLAGLEPEYQQFADNGMFNPSNAEVLCSAFRTPALLEKYDFPLQPLGRMHFGLYTIPERAMDMMSVKITEWPRMRVAYSPVSQGRDADRERYFSHAHLSPEYVEFAKSANAVEALRDEKVDALFLYTPLGKRPEGLMEIIPIGSRNEYFAVRRDRPDLMKRLAKAYREYYIDKIDEIDASRQALLGVPKPRNRVRIAAYSRGDLFNVEPDGSCHGSLTQWMKSIGAHTRWTPEYVYGNYDESLEDVKNGRLDLIGGVSFASHRREEFLYPHTPIGMLRVYLWAKQESKYMPGNPESWKGMKVGLLAGAISAERAKRQFGKLDIGIKCREFSSDSAMIKAYMKGEVDACVDVEMPELKNEKALHVYASNPMYIATAVKRKDLFEELEKALDEICDDFPRYLRMISEHHYGEHSEMAALSMNEAKWLQDRKQKAMPVVIDFSPWKFDIHDKHGRPQGFAGALLSELSRRTGLVFLAAPQTGVQTAEAKFMRGDTDLWIPYPDKAATATYGATSVFSSPVPESAGQFFGSTDPTQEFELFARTNVDPELISILRKTLTGIDSTKLQDIFVSTAAEKRVVHRVFGLTGEELSFIIMWIVAAIVAAIILYGMVMMRLLKREARRANEAAQMAEEHAQAKTRFLAMMSHELRTPLNAVIGFAEFLSKKKTDEEKRKEYTEGILCSANALLELINDILDLSKLEAGAMHMRSGVCDMTQLLREMPAIFGYRVRRHGVKLNVTVPEDGSIPPLRLSQQGMRQVLINLVGNAAKFTERGNISVRTQWNAATRTLGIEISDTGCGMSDEKMARLFDPFVQDISSRMQSSAGELKGTGLGLPIVKRMVNNSGGTISVRSKIGEGTSFSIEIPDIEIVTDVSSIPRAAEVAMRTVLPERVLVVDDMTMNRKILGIHLANEGIKEVRYAENGEAALEVMKDWIPDTVLTDMWMPKMDGTQLAEAMRKDRRLAEIPIVAVTADVDVGSSYDMSLFAKVIAKPVTGDKLHALFGEI